MRKSTIENSPLAGNSDQLRNDVGLRNEVGKIKISTSVSL